MHQVFDHEQIKIDSINVRSEFIDSIFFLLKLLNEFRSVKEWGGEQSKAETERNNNERSKQVNRSHRHRFAQTQCLYSLENLG